jgi:hypothetical protein
MHMPSLSLESNQAKEHSKDGKRQKGKEDGSKNILFRLSF